MNLYGNNYQIHTAEYVQVLETHKKPGFWTVKLQSGKTVAVPSICLFIAGPDNESINKAKELQIKCQKSWSTVIQKYHKYLVSFYCDVLKGYIAKGTVTHNRQMEMDNFMRDLTTLLIDGQRDTEELQRSSEEFMKLLSYKNTGSNHISEFELNRLYNPVLSWYEHRRNFEDLILLNNRSDKFQYMSAQTKRIANEITNLENTRSMTDKLLSHLVEEISRLKGPARVQSVPYARIDDAAQNRSHSQPRFYQQDLMTQIWVGATTSTAHLSDTQLRTDPGKRTVRLQAGSDFQPEIQSTSMTNLYANVVGYDLKGQPIFDTGFQTEEDFGSSGPDTFRRSGYLAHSVDRVAQEQPRSQRAIKLQTSPSLLDSLVDERLREESFEHKPKYRARSYDSHINSSDVMAQISINYNTSRVQTSPQGELTKKISHNRKVQAKIPSSSLDLQTQVGYNTRDSGIQFDPLVFAEPTKQYRHIKQQIENYVRDQSCQAETMQESVILVEQVPVVKSGPPQDTRSARAPSVDTMTQIGIIHKTIGSNTDLLASYDVLTQIGTRHRQSGLSVNAESHYRTQSVGPIGRENSDVITQTGRVQKDTSMNTLQKVTSTTQQTVLNLQDMTIFDTRTVTPDLFDVSMQCSM
ncbi:hypothetical protein Ciccas_009068 [Cichlidogyrus casuarinus]|uniref:Uncharacterized protein n=1 Tax=Cichlidogyrus casuarinus TaxID=1844966 RepID=A0ABD2PYS7_9PLAT